MDVSPIPGDQLEPFAESGKNIEKNEQRRYAALLNEIGDDPLIEDLVNEADRDLWKSRRPLRAGRTVGLSSPLPVASGFVMGDEYRQVAEQLAGQPLTAESAWPFLMAFGGSVLVGGYGWLQFQRAGQAVTALAEDMEPFTAYQVVEPYEVGRFERNRDIEDLLYDARTVRTEPRIEEFYRGDDQALDTGSDAVQMYRDVLDRLESVHRDGVDDQTAEGVNLYGSGFLQPFFGDDEAVQRAEEIESSGVAQVVKVKETAKNNDGVNEILAEDYVFRLELVYNGQTVAKFDGTCTEDATELGDPLIEKVPKGNRNRHVSFSTVMTAYEDIGDQLGMDMDRDDYTIRLSDRGGIPRHLYDTAETLGRSVYGVGRGTYRLGKGLVNALDIRGATR